MRNPKSTLAANLMYICGDGTKPFGKRDRMKYSNAVQFYAGLIAALGSAAWTFFGTFHPSHTVVLIVGIVLIATSKYRLLK
jgi:hypothetical protein